MTSDARRLQASELRKTFTTKTVVDGVSFEIRSGEVVGLLGPNGAGKTTSFYMVVGLLKPTAGAVLFDGKDITELPMYRRARNGIAYLAQEASVFRKLTVEDNIMAILQAQKGTRSERNERLKVLMEDLHISHLKGRYAYMLSGGERRRVEIARCLVLRPSFLLLDEPFAGLDPIAVADIQKLVKGLTMKGIGVLITDHNIRETLGICDRAYVLHGGKVVESGNPDHIIASPKARQVYLGEEFRY
jgi:lipopolysaccharide export system ATP-binding protein